MFALLKSLALERSLLNRLISIGAALLAFHVLLFASIMVSTSQYPILAGLVLLAYGLGLRHAVDPDHIAAIDNTTRKLMQDGQKPVGVGFFFAFGHSTIVLVMCVLVAMSAAFVNEHLPAFKETGALISTAVSSLFLLIIGTINFIVLIQTWRTWRQVLKGQKFDEKSLEEHLDSQGLLTRILRPLLKIISHSWQMFGIGLLFGLGFDTASEVALLSISGTTSASGMPLHVLILIPLAFTAGMALIDTLDGILMLGAYGWAFLKPVRKLYYNMNITFISVVVALLIGGVEAGQLLSSEFHLTGAFWSALSHVKIDSWGFYIIGLFVISWIGSVMFYKVRGIDKMGEQHS